MNQIFTYEQASHGEIDFVRTTIRNNPAKYGTVGEILVQDPINSANFALLVYDFENIPESRDCWPWRPRFLWV